MGRKAAAQMQEQSVGAESAWPWPGPELCGERADGGGGDDAVVMVIVVVIGIVTVVEMVM